MAEQTPSSNGDSSDFLRKKIHQERQGDSNLTPGQRSMPPQRGLLKRSKGPESPGRPDTGGNQRPTRKPITREQVAAKPVLQNTNSQILTPPPAPGNVGRPSSPTAKTPGPPPSPSPRNRPKRTRGPVDVTGIGSRAGDAAIQRRMQAAEEKRKADAEKKRLEEEKVAAREAERERKRQMRELAAKKAEEERIRKEKELEQKRAEAERVRLAKEAEAKKLEEERLKKEKEEEARRLEELKKFQEEERERIFKSIESSQGKLGDKEVALAKTIADEMVKRNMHWNGYISLHSGIGGAMLD